MVGVKCYNYTLQAMVGVTVQNRVWLSELVRETTFWYIDLGAVYLATCLILSSIFFLLVIAWIWSMKLP